jgi:DNA excision repair protein ERCC-5
MIPKQSIVTQNYKSGDVFEEIISDSPRDKLNETLSDMSVPLGVAAKPESELKSLTSQNSSNELTTTINLETLQDDLSEELAAVKAKHRKAMSVADTVNKGIVSEVKELLTIFGIPFLDAPGEAEAQCAELCNLGVCEGVITDDSDIFLFGNVRVYKDVFKKDRDMRCFTSDGVQECLGLTRRSLIDLAQLTGSDYCSGVRGIGCVLALEIISKYKTLAEFVKLPDAKYKKFDFSGLPNFAAVEAYLHPKVNNSKEEFSWNEIDVFLIKDFMFKKLGWTSNKVEETLKPVLESLNSKTKQKSITNFFNISQPKQPGSKRIQNAIGEMRGAPAIAKITRKRKQVPKKSGKSKSKKTKYVCSEDSESD